MPAPDDLQNIMLTSATETDGYTNLVFYRKRKTGDTEKDVEIKVLNDILQFTLKRGLFYLSIDIEITLNYWGRFLTQERPVSSRAMGGRLLLSVVISCISGYSLLPSLKFVPKLSMASGPHLKPWMMAVRLVFSAMTIIKAFWRSLQFHAFGSLHIPERLSRKVAWVCSASINLR